MMVQEMVTQFKRKVCDEIELEQEGVDRYIVHNPFLFDDGDHLQIYLERNEAGEWILTDEGATYMQLSYENLNLDTATRTKIMEKAKRRFGIEDQEGELSIVIRDEQYGDALFSFVQGILHISDVEYLRRENVKSAFYEDFKALVRSAAPEDKVHFNYYDPELDPNRIYPVDCMIDVGARPLFVFAIANSDQCLKATISLMQLEKMGKKFTSVAIFENQEEIARRTLAQLSNACDKQISDLGAGKERFPAFVRDQMALCASEGAVPQSTHSFSAGSS